MDLDKIIKETESKLKQLKGLHKELTALVGTVVPPQAKVVPHVPHKRKKVRVTRAGKATTDGHAGLKRSPKPCRNCKKVFYVRRKSKLFCSTVCRKRHYEEHGPSRIQAPRKSLSVRVSTDKGVKLIPGDPLTAGVR